MAIKLLFMNRNNVSITIFTPTYNRAHLLPRLYESLILLENCDFEWVIVDDGSIDSTEQVVNEFIKKAFFPIFYFKKENEGKHTAINEGVMKANGELFFIVDSDDFLPSDSLDKITHYYKKIEGEDEIAGVVGKRKIINNNAVNYNFKQKEFICSAFDFRYNYNYTGDMAEVYRTDVLRKFLFPVFEGEKFVTESVVWFRIAKKYRLLYFDEFIYNCEYQEDGLTDNYRKLIENNPKGSLLYYRELLTYSIPESEKRKIARIYYRLARKHKIGYWRILKEIGVKNFVKQFI